MRLDSGERKREKNRNGKEAMWKNPPRRIESAETRSSGLDLVTLAFSLCVAALLASCGYGVGGRASRLPPGIHVIAIPVFQNQTKQYRIEQLMTEAVVHEFLARSKYHIVSQEADADAVLRGQITGIESVPMVFDTSTNPSTSTPSARATTMLVTVTMSVQLVQNGTGEVLYRNDKFVFREPYEVSTDIPSFFDEQSTALDRMAQKFASQLVADILENF